MSDFLTVPQAAKKLNISTSGIYRRVYKGEMPFRKFSGRVLIPVRDLEEFLTRVKGTTIEEALARVEAKDYK